MIIRKDSHKTIKLLKSTSSTPKLPVVVNPHSPFDSSASPHMVSMDDFHEEEANRRLEAWQDRLSKVKKYMKGMKEREMCWESHAKRARRNAEKRT